MFGMLVKYDNSCNYVMSSRTCKQEQKNSKVVFELSIKIVVC